MHPFGLYLAITDSQREHGWPTKERQVQFAGEDATPVVAPEPVSRMRRLAGIVRRRVLRTAGA
jgi:hypothetical protein